MDNGYLDLLLSNSFHSFVNICTRLPTTHTHSCIDHVFVKFNDDNVLNNTQAGVLQILAILYYINCLFWIFFF